MTSRDDWNPLTWKQNSELWIGIKFTKPSWQTAPVRCLMYIGLNDLSSSVPLLHVHTEPDSYSCQHKKLFGIVQTLKKYNSKYFAFSDWLQSLGKLFTTNWHIFQIQQYTIDLTIDISSRNKEKKIIIFQDGFIKIMRGKKHDTDCWPITVYVVNRTHCNMKGCFKDVKGCYGKFNWGTWCRMSLTEYSKELNYLWQSMYNNYIK